MAPPGSHPIQRAEAECGLRSIGGPPWPPIAHDADSWIAALGSLPLMYQPGERWLYNTSAQVLGVLVARADGRRPRAVLRERIFDPLGMADTGFTVPARGLGRLDDVLRARCRHRRAAACSTIPPTAGGAARRAFPDGSGGLVSTIDDYWTFVSMVLQAGSPAAGASCRRSRWR